MKVLVSDNLSASGVEILKKESGIEVDVKTGLSKEELMACLLYTSPSPRDRG